MTPRVRVDIMDAYDCDYQIRRAEDAFPIKRTEYTKYYLNAVDCTMQPTPPEKTASVSYEANTGEVCFDMEFTEDTELTGYMFLRLYVEARGHGN